MTRRKLEYQLPLFETPPAQDTPGEESAGLYQMVQLVRWCGHSIHRAGADHVLDRRRLSTRELGDLVSVLVQQLH
jgi:hypothetical protein